jgi:hypothetical protein
MQGHSVGEGELHGDRAEDGHAHRPARLALGDPSPRRQDELLLGEAKEVDLGVEDLLESSEAGMEVLPEPFLCRGVSAHASGGFCMFGPVFVFGIVDAPAHGTILARLTARTWAMRFAGRRVLFSRDDGANHGPCRRGATAPPRRGCAGPRQRRAGRRGADRGPSDARCTGRREDVTARVGPSFGGWRRRGAGGLPRRPGWDRQAICPGVRSRRTPLGPGAQWPPLRCCSQSCRPVRKADNEDLTAQRGALVDARGLA